MQIHTFIAESATEAVEQIRTQLGPAAVVLSVRKLPRTGVSRLLRHEQIEVVAGIEEKPAAPPPDPLAELRAEIRGLKEQITSARIAAPAAPAPAPPPRVDYGHDYQGRGETGIAAILPRSGLLPVLAEQILSDISASGVMNRPVREQIEIVSEALRRRWRSEPVHGQTAVHLFIGAPGCGKSTVLCKMLAQSSLAESHPAVVYQLDTHVTNTSPQPSFYSEILGAHFNRTLPERFEWREESVFIDVPGIEPGNDRALKQLAEVLRAFGVPEIHLVLNAAYESAHLLEQVRFFSALGDLDLIVSHLDEESRWGKIWNLVLGTNYNVRFLSCGQNIPGEFLPASAEVILDRQFRGK